MRYIVAALYQFKQLTNIDLIQAKLRDQCEVQDISGTLLLAPEGINGTVAGSRQAINALKDFLIHTLNFDDLEYKESFADSPPFHRLKIKIKPEIVTLRAATADPSQVVGDYVDPKNWNTVIQDPDTIVIDTRNDYEVKLGTFNNAINPKTQKFVDFPKFIEENFQDQKHKKFAIFCTGGIRCEKASSYMKNAGFNNVRHLKGGILKYLETVPEEQTEWQGECFVFDNRVTVKHNLELGDYELCHGCRQPLSPDEKQSPGFDPGVSCGRCYLHTTGVQKARFRERQNQIQLAKKRGDVHVGRKNKLIHNRLILT